MKTQSWWLSLVQGIVALALGLYLLVAPGQAWFQVGALAAVFLLVSGLIDFFGNLFSHLLLRSRARRFRGLVGIFFGGILLLLAWIKPARMSLATAYLFLAFGLVVYGGLGIWVSLFARRGRPVKWISVLLNGLLLVWGLAILFDRGSEKLDLKLVSVLALLLIGAALVVWALITRSRGGDEDAEPVADAPPAPGSALPAATAAAATPAPAVSSVTPTVVAPTIVAPAGTAPAASAAMAAATELTSDSEPKPTGEQS